MINTATAAPCAALPRPKVSWKDLVRFHKFIAAILHGGWRITALT